MKGKVLGFDQSENTGVISGDDGNRYSFRVDDWKAQGSPRSGQQVDFQETDGVAKEIYVVTAAPAGGVQKKVVAALFAFFLGAFGAHKFYLGYTKQGVIMLLIFLFGWILLGIPSVVIGIIAFIEAILYISKSDDDFERIYVEGQKAWF